MLSTMENPSQPYAGKAPQQRQLVEANDRDAVRVRRFCVLMLVRAAAQRLAQADELRELAAKAGAA